MPFARTARHDQWLILIVSLYLVLGLATSVVVPLGESPDEVDHFLYIQHLVRERAFPVMDPVFANNETMEANQPPLYYSLGALPAGLVDRGEPADLTANACFAAGANDPGRQTFYRHDPAEQFPWRGPYLAFHLVRLMSVLMGAGTVVLAYALGRAIAPDDRHLGSAAAAILAFNPQFIFITASANNDALTTLLGAAVVLLGIKLAQAPFPPSWRRVIPLAILIGLGALTKFSLLGLWPLAFLAVLWPAWRQRRIPWAGLALLALLPILIAGWWYWRADHLYGDPLAWDVHLAAKGAYILRTAPVQMADLLDFARIHFQSYWGWFGWLNIQLPVWVYLILAAAGAAAAMGLLKWLRTGRLSQRPRLAPTAMLFLALAVLIVYASLFRYLLTINWSGYQGRLAYTAAAPIAVLLAAGLASLGGSRLSLAAGGALLPLAIASLVLVIAPAYPRPQIYQPAPQTAVFAPTCARFGDRLQLEAYDLDGPTRPGTTLPVTLHAYGLASSDGPHALAVQIVGREGRIVGKAQTELAWEAGQVISATLNVPVAAAAAPARAVLQAGLLAPAGGWQPATTPGGRPLDSPVSLTTLKIAPAEPLTAAPQFEVGADFGHQLALLGYDLVEAESAITLTLYWQAAAVMRHDYTLFVHLLAADGRLITQHDGQPHGGWYPTTIWAAGEVVAETVTLTLPLGAPPGPYRAAVGVYRLETLERLPVEWAGRAQPDDQLILAVELE